MSISMIQRYLPVPQSNLFYCTALHAFIAMKGKPAARRLRLAVVEIFD